MKKISAEIIADSIDSRGNRITSYILTYPRFIHSEIMTHRMFSRNAASSRAIPFNKMVKMIEKDPFIPIAWQKDHKGMQGTEYFADNEMPNSMEPNWFTNRWLEARDKAVEQALIFNKAGLTKQLCNRLLEPFQWYTCLVTATEYSGFFELRCPKYYFKPEDIYFKSKKDFRSKYHECFGSDEFVDWNIVEWQSINISQAEIHIQALAEAMWDAKNESTPKELKAGEWHIPFGDKMDDEYIQEELAEELPRFEQRYQSFLFEKVKIATARCARLSYMTFDGEIDYEKDIKLHDMLLESRHMSPFEHCARVATDEEYMYNCKKVNHQGCETERHEFGSISEDVFIDDKDMGWFNNFRGFIPYRYIIENGDN